VAVPEAPLERTEHGVVPKGPGWYVLNAREARWYNRGDRRMVCDLEGDHEFDQVGVNLYVLAPGHAMSMYHWEADQEDFLVLSGEALLIVEGEERPLRQWDFVHTPRRVPHTILGAGAGLCAVLAVGARVDSVDNPDWGAYPVDAVAQRHGAGVARETNEPREAHADWPPSQPVAYQDGWLPGS
jgi:uncharacterized cupin superfamily protein